MNKEFGEVAQCIHIMVKKIKTIKTKMATMQETIDRQNQVLDLIPRWYLTDTDGISPQTWILWARDKLGYGQQKYTIENYSQSSERQRRTE